MFSVGGTHRFRFVDMPNIDRTFVELSFLVTTIRGCLLAQHVDRRLAWSVAFKSTAWRNNHNRSAISRSLTASGKAEMRWARYLQVVALPLGKFHDISIAAVGAALPSASGGGIAADAVIPERLGVSSEHWSGSADSPTVYF